MLTSTPTQAGIALIVGGSRGLGFLVAAELIRTGYPVVITSRDEEKLAAAVATLRQEHPGAQAEYRVCDVTDGAAVEAMVAEVEQSLGPIAVAIHVAGIIQVGPLKATTRTHFEQCINVMLWGPINLSLAVLPRMTERGRGHLGTVTSVGGRVSPPRLVPYSTAKFGAVGLMEGLSAELAGTGVSATCIIPGLMRTGSHDAATFYGDPAKQYTWFASLAALPVLTVSGEAAARQIVRGVLKGKPIVMVSASARVASQVHGAVPRMTIHAMRAVSRLLPTGTQSTPVPGSSVREQAPRWVRQLTRLGDRAGTRSNQ